MIHNSIQPIPGKPSLAPQRSAFSTHTLGLLCGLLLGMLAFLALSPTAQAQQQPSTCANEIVVAQGDTLSGLAIRHLGSSAAYPAIVSATNRAAQLDARFTPIVNPNAISPGWRLCASSDLEPVAPAIAQPTGTGATESTAPDQAPSPQPDTDALPFGRPVVEGAPHPLSIEFLRAQDYPGSDIRIKQTLNPGTNYNRYVISYLSEGLEIDAYMTVPQGTSPATGWPVVIFNHGYIPPDVYRTTERYIAYTDAFARAGYIVFRADYRGHGFSQGQAGGAYSRPDYTIDVLNAVASVKRYPQADPQRIGMWGHSMGGYITLRAMLVDADIKAGVIWAGVVASYPDLLEHWRGRTPSGTPRGGGWRATLTEQYGSPTENPDFWASISANTYVAELSGPIQLHHGSADSSVPLLFSELLYAQMQAAEASVELFTYAGDDHNIAANLNTALQRSVAYFDRYVK